MPHQCVRCGKLYKDGTVNLLSGCADCGSKYFFFIKKSSIDKAKKLAENLTKEDKLQIEEDIKEVIGDKEDLDSPVFLDIENIRTLSPGKFEIDLVDMFRGKPLICKLGEGKYIIDLVSTFDSVNKEK